MTLLEGETDGVTDLDCLPDDASWLCSLILDHILYCVWWPKASSGNNKVEVDEVVS